MSRWLDRPGYVAVIAFLGGAVAAVGALLFIVFLRDGDEEDARQLVATGTPPAATATTPRTPAATASPRPTATATPTGFLDPEEALIAFIRDELKGAYIGACPTELAPEEELPGGYCAIELYRSADLVTFNIGLVASEALGEAVITPNEDGTWSLTFLRFPELGAQITVGADAMVFQAQDCLRFREAPSTNAPVLSCQIDGTRGRVVEGPVEADGFTWWRLEGLGWASSQYLAPAAQ